MVDRLIVASASPRIANDPERYKM